MVSEECRKVGGLRRMQEGWWAQKNAGKLEITEGFGMLEDSQECRKVGGLRIMQESWKSRRNIENFIDLEECRMVELL